MYSHEVNILLALQPFATAEGCDEVSDACFEPHVLIFVHGRFTYVRRYTMFFLHHTSYECGKVQRHPIFSS